MTQVWFEGDGMIFGALESPLQGQSIGKLPGLLMGDVVMIVMIALVLLVLFLYWAKFLRNRKARKKKLEAQRVYRDGEEKEASEEPEPAELPDSRRRYKYRWKRRKHRKRNPTLSETGGLPSARADEPESP